MDYEQILDEVRDAAAKAQGLTPEEGRIANISRLHPNKRHAAKTVRASVALAMSRHIGRSAHWWLVQIGVSRPAYLMAWMRQQTMPVLRATSAYRAASRVARLYSPESGAKGSSGGHLPGDPQTLLRARLRRWIELSPETPDIHLIDRARRELDAVVTVEMITELRRAG